MAHTFGTTETLREPRPGHRWVPVELPESMLDEFIDITGTVNGVRLGGFRFDTEAQELHFVYVTDEEQFKSNEFKTLQAAVNETQGAGE